MNSIHDLGGMDGFGPVVREKNEPLFHEAWERRVFGMLLTTMGQGLYNLDELRHAIERMSPAHYLASPYYEHWLAGLERVLLEKGRAAAAEIEFESVMSEGGAAEVPAPPALAAAAIPAAPALAAAPTARPQARVARAAPRPPPGEEPMAHARPGLGPGAGPRFLPSLADVETPRQLKPSRGGRGDLDPSAAALKWLLAVAAVAAIATSVVLYGRLAPDAKDKPSGAAIPTTHSHPVALAVPASSPIRKAAAATPRRVSTPAAAAQHSLATNAAAAGASSGGSTPAVPKRTETATPTRSFAVAVGRFLDEGRAEAERSRLTTTTGMAASVRTVTADSVSRFELVLGLFRSHDAAERAASDLISRGLVDEARVVAQVQSPAPR